MADASRPRIWATIQIRLWQFGTRSAACEPHGALRLPQGSGPRHFARSSSGVVYVNTEYTCEIAVLEPAGPWLELRDMFPASAGGVQPGDAAAEICLDPAERHLYVGVRGSDRICTLALDADALPKPLHEFPCGGNWPRHHCFDGERLLVALQLSDAIAMLDLGADANSSRPAGLFATGSPTCLLPAR